MAKIVTKNIPTPHINAKAGQIAKRVIMPGDPKRAQWIAETFLTNPKLVSDVRGILAYTGKYKNVPVTVMAHGMGIPSACIYTYELFNFYGVDVIYRIGSCGVTNKAGVKVGSVVLASKAWSDTPTACMRVHPVNNYFYPTTSCVKNIESVAKKHKIAYSKQPVICENFFYKEPAKGSKFKLPCEVIEMESWGIFLNAKLANKHAACLLTVSDNIQTHESMSAIERQTSFKDMVKLALESVILEKVKK